MGKRFVAWAVGLVIACAGAADAATPDLSRMTGGEVAALTRAMPKGGELHNHMGGGIFAETWMAWAIEDGVCIDTKALAFARCQAGAEQRPASALNTDDALRSAMMDSLSVRHPGFRDRSGHDQFFTAFQRFGAAGYKRNGDVLAVTLDTLAAQNTFYLEAMVTPQGFAASAKGAQAGWKGGDFAAQKAANSALGLEGLVPAAIAETDALEARARGVMKCDTPQATPGCQVTLRYLVQTNRIAPPEQTFAQLQLGVALVAADKRWVGLQMVAPEDSAPALANYGLHMRMIDFLTDHGRATPVALHAGELSLKYATPAELSYHVADAVRIAGARRIGHGTDLPLEAGAEALAAEMAAKGVLVEVNLSSNAAILEVSGKAHPYAWLRQRGVSVSLSTDDAGILRIDLSHEYARAADEGANYDDLKRSARNAIAFSFLSGVGLWDDPGIYRRPAKACAGQVGGEAPKPGACAELVAASDKAREQWRHERLLKTFEAGLR
jgi:adenosine deaminase